MVKKGAIATIIIGLPAILLAWNWLAPWLGFVILLLCIAYIARHCCKREDIDPNSDESYINLWGLRPTNPSKLYLFIGMRPWVLAFLILFSLTLIGNALF